MRRKPIPLPRRSPKRKLPKRRDNVWWIFPELKGLAQEVLASGVHPLILAKHLGLRKDTAYSWKRDLSKVDWRIEAQSDPDMIKRRGEFLRGLVAARREHDGDQTKPSHGEDS